MTTEDVVIDLPSGIHLEGNLWKPLEAISGTQDSPSEGNKLAICLHPWSWLGGRKDDPVLASLLDPLLSRNYHILLYNSRGVGRSAGWASFTGFSEAKDLEEVARWALRKVSNVQSLVILGYSHGSLIASLFPVLPDVKTSHVLLSYPLGPRACLTWFNSSFYTTALQGLIHHVDSNVLVIFGGNDEFTSQSKYRSWATSLQGNVEMVEMEKASHFWHGRSSRELAATLTNWLP